MKNGLVLLLLMAALVAMTVSAGAMAPVVGPLPAVVVGGDDVIDQATTDVHLLRYVNVFNLGDPGVIKRKTNPDDLSKLSVWYTVSGGGALNVSTSASLVAAMDAAEATALVDDGTRPAAAKNIAASSTDLWLSLIEDSWTPAGKSAPESAAKATLADNGATADQLLPVENLQRTVTLYAVDTDAVTTAVGTGSFDVYTLIDEVDGPKDVDNVANGLTKGGAAGQWQAVGDPNHSASGIGFVGAARKPVGFNYATWGMIINPAVNPVGQIYAVKATITGSAASAVNTPGFRLWYISNAGVHSGGAHFKTAAGLTATAENIPATGADKECRVYWSTPRDLTDMQDGGFMGAKRDYVMQFDMVQEEDSDIGNALTMTAFSLDLIPRPVDTTPVKKWADGTNGSVTMSPDPAAPGSGWSISGDTVTGFQAGTGVVGDGNITLGMGTKNNVYKKANLFAGPDDAATYAPYTSGKLIRSTWVVQAAGNSVPNFRLLSAFFTPYPTPVQSQVLHYENLNYDESHKATKPSATRVVLPGTPKFGGSVIEGYAYTHTAPAGAPGFVLPQVDIVQTDRSTTDAGGVPTAGYAANWNGWGRPGDLTITSIAYEVLNP